MVQLSDESIESESYVITKRPDESLTFEENTGKLIYTLISANSRCHYQMVLHDASERLCLTLRRKNFTLHNTWIATSPSGDLFEVRTRYSHQRDSDLIVIVKRSEESYFSNEFDYKIRRSKANQSYFVYKGDSPTVLSRVVFDASDKNKYRVEIDTKENCEILKNIVFSVAAIVDAIERDGRLTELVGNIERGEVGKIVRGVAFFALSHVWDDVFKGIVPNPLKS